MPLTESSIPFKVYIDEPTSGFPVAEIVVTQTNVAIDYQYPNYRDKGTAKIYGSTKKGSSSEYVTLNFKKALGSMYSNVKLYYGTAESKKYIGKIVCFHGDYLVVLYPSGNTELKERKAIVNWNDHWYVDKDDPAISAGLYYECN